MSQVNLERVKTLIAPAEIFAEEKVTNEVSMENYQNAKIVIQSGAGEETETTAHIIGVTYKGTEHEIVLSKIKIGNNIENIIDLTANQLSHNDCSAFKLKIDAVENSTIKGCVLLVLGEPRYGYDDCYVEPIVETTETTETTETNTEE